MATVRYQVDGVPQTGWAHAWFPTPPLSPAGAFSLSRFIHGYPGTMRVASPKPAGSHTMSDSAEWMPWGSAEVGPDFFAPQLYWTDIAEQTVGATNAGNGVGYMPHRVAVDVEPMVPQGVIGIIPGRNRPAEVAMGGRKVGGVRSMHWPRSFIRWPSLSGEYQS